MTTILSSIPWPDVVAVGIRTTADGPFVEDVFWQFLLCDRCIEIPGLLVDNAALDELYAHLPGVASEKLIRAMGLTDERIYRIWHHEESRYSPSDADLAERFRALVGRVGGDPELAAPVFDRVRTAWGSERRSYHCVEHLVDCLRELDGAGARVPSADLAELALWYHDVVYEPRAQDNEERSAEMLLHDACALEIPNDSAAVAAEIVRATTHASDPIGSNRFALHLVLDIDLSILGRDVLRFMDYEYGVEEEYSPSSILAFRIGRGRFLASLLAQPRIFHTEYFRARYERSARSQIEALLASHRYRGYRWLRWFPSWHQRNGRVLADQSSTNPSTGRREDRTRTR